MQSFDLFFVAYIFRLPFVDLTIYGSKELFFSLCAMQVTTEIVFTHRIYTLTA